jgi:DNA-directed RNA polymerase
MVKSDIARHPEYSRQVALERAMRGTGETRAKNRIAKSVAGEVESETVYGHAMLVTVIEPLSAMVKNYCIEVADGKPGPRRCAALYLRRVSPDQAAFLIAKTIINTIFTRKLERRRFLCCLR